MNRLLRFALAGLQTGMTGALAMLLWTAVASVWMRRSIWWIPNLVASAHYGQTAIRYGAGIYTIVGVATVLAFYGALGVVFGAALRDAAASFRIFCLAMAFSLVVFWAVERWFWRDSTPGSFYAPGGQFLFAHLIFGCLLARYPATLRRQMAV